MKISEPKWSPYSKELNQEAVDKPRAGDYWSERMCPYFLVVNVQGDKYTVLCCMPNADAKMARITGKDCWEFDYTKHSVVTADWIKKHVSYSSGTGFVADVVRNNPKMLAIVDEWRDANPDYVPGYFPPRKQYAEWWLGS